MKSKVVNNSNQLNISIRNNLRLLGFKACNKSTKVLSRTIFYIKSNNIDIFEITAKEVYVAIAKFYEDMTPKKVKDNIDYALAHRNKLKSKINFQTVFKFEYTEEIFTNKNFIEEFSNIIF